MSALFAPVCSITPTKRRRYLWAAWWTAPPSEDPFRKPDASQGGARTRDQAKREAEKAAGRSLVEIEPRFARAWTRILIGEPPWSDRKGRQAHGGEVPNPSVWAILGITSKATDTEIKRAFRKRALETHPDQGGDAEAFRAVKEAYEKALIRGRRAPRARRG